MAKKTKNAKRSPKRATKSKRKHTEREPEPQDPVTAVASMIDRLGDELLDGMVKIAGDLDELAKALRI